MGAGKMRRIEFHCRVAGKCDDKSGGVYADCKYCSFGDRMLHGEYRGNSGLWSGAADRSSQHGNRSAVFRSGNGSEPDDWTGNAAVWNLSVYYRGYGEDQLPENDQGNASLLYSAVWSFDLIMHVPADWNLASVHSGIKEKEA